MTMGGSTNMTPNLVFAAIRVTVLFLFVPKSEAFHCHPASRSNNNAFSKVQTCGVTTRRSGSFVGASIIRRRRSNSGMTMMTITFDPHDSFAFSSSSILSSVPVFDGSTITDPIVYSNAYWINLKSDLVSYVFGQLIAGTVFVIVVSLASKQIQKLTESTLTSLNEIFKIDPESALTQEPTLDINKLILSIIIDSIGISSVKIAGDLFGELLDVIWAPIAALTLRSLYSSNAVFLFEFTEELFPLTDIIPLATVCWIVDTFFSETEVAKILQIGNYNSSRMKGNLINVDTKNNDKDDGSQS